MMATALPAGLLWMGLVVWAERRNSERDHVRLKKASFSTKCQETEELDHLGARSTLVLGGRSMLAAVATYLVVTGSVALISLTGFPDLFSACAVIGTIAAPVQAALLVEHRVKSHQGT